MSKKKADASKTETINDKENTSTKKSVKNFPSLPFEEALKLSTGIWECASGQKVRRLTLFDHLKKSPDSGPSRTLITASSKYGLTSGGYQADYLELTPIGKTASNPDGNKIEIVKARFELAIQRNEFFNYLYESYKSMKLPTNKVMEDSVVQKGLDVGDANRCVETFIVNAKFVGLIQTIAGAQRLICIDHLIEDLSKDISNTNLENKNALITSDVSTKQKQAKSNVNYDNVCFYITPIGEEGSEERKHSDMFLECIISPVLEEFGLTAIRADKIDSPGIITSQILEYIIRSKIVIADLSFHNPNVFYELAVRHMKGLPAIHLCRSKDTIPFDISDFRTIFLDTSDIYSFVPQLETYKFQISGSSPN